MTAVMKHIVTCAHTIYMGTFQKKPNKALRHLVSAYTDYMEAKEATLWSVVGKTIWAGLQLIGLFWLFFTVKGCFGG